MSDSVSSSQVKGLPPGLAKRVQVVENIAYVAIGDQLQIVDITDSSNPIVKGSYIGTVNYVTVVGTFAYVCGDNSGLKILDISNPAQPVVKGSFGTGASESIVVVGNYAYVPDPINGLQIIDITNPAQPSLKSTYKTTGAISNVTVVGNYAYVVNAELGLTILDVSDPANPALKGSFDTPGMATNVTVVGNYAYVSDTTSLQVIDISNPVSPTFTSSYQISSSQSVLVIGNTAYVTDDDGDDDDDDDDDGATVQVLDITNPTKLVFKGTYGLLGTPGSVTTAGDQLYVLNVSGSSSQTTYNVNVIDSRIAIPLLPVKLSKFEFKQRGSEKSEIVRGSLLTNDSVSGGSGNDEIFGGVGKAKAGNDQLLGDDGNDKIFAGVGKDMLDGGEGDDMLDGGKGKDSLIGGEGDDTLLGGNGEDILLCGEGKDLLRGGKDKDMFVFEQVTVRPDQDIIADFNAKQDIIDLREIFVQQSFKVVGVGDFKRFEQFIKVEQMGASAQVKIDVDGKGSGTNFVSVVTLTGVQATNLSVSNFSI